MLNPVEHLAARFIAMGHEEDAESLLDINFYMQEFLASGEPMDADAEDLRELLSEVVAYWART